MLGSGECVWRGWEKSKSAATVSTVRLQSWHRVRASCVPSPGLIKPSRTGFNCRHSGTDGKTQKKRAKWQETSQSQWKGKNLAHKSDLKKKKAYQMNKWLNTHSGKINMLRAKWEHQFRVWYRMILWAWDISNQIFLLREGGQVEQKRGPGLGQGFPFLALLILEVEWFFVANLLAHYRSLAASSTNQRLI